MEFVAVVCISEGVTESVKLFKGEDRSEISSQAEQHFLDLCREKIWNFDEYTQDDIDAILDNGYEKYGDNSICICWPD